MATMRELKGRINSVHSSQKITGAMKMISSARLRKAESALLQSLPFRAQLQNLHDHIIAAGCDYESPWVKERKIENVALVVFASDDGLCGSFNITLYKKLLEAIAAYGKLPDVLSVSVYPVGRKIEGEVRRLPDIKALKISSAFVRKEYAQGTKELADELMDKFLKKEYDRVDVIYTHYKSIASQTVYQQQFLPVLKKEEEKDREKEPWYIYEPDCETVLNMLYPLMMHATMYEYLLENRTSEQGARIIAMQTANDNAVKLLGELHLEYNKLRQQGITSELLDIAGGSVNG